MTSETTQGRRPKAVVLFSGGLDSLLACETLLRAGVEVVALRHHSVFYPAREGADADRPYPVITREISDDMVRLVGSPRYGLGKNANPCLDCKQLMYRLALAEAQRQGADFIATGEVLGQRPMSQRKDAFRLMEKGAGVEGLVVRPLSGKLLPPTLPEQQGLIRREDMLDISGRSRKRQLELARQWGLSGYSSPAGGCKLTDPQYAGRVLKLRELGRLTVQNARAARHGRFLALEDGSVLLVGRNREDNERLLADAPEGALMLELAERPGPLACLIGEPSAQELDQARRLVLRYSRFGTLPPEQVRIGSVAEARGWSSARPADAHR